MSTVTLTPGKAPADALDGVPLLAPLSAGDRAALVGECRWFDAHKNEEVVERDSPNKDMVIVTKGRVRIVNYSLSGREVAFATAQAGDYFGELSALDGQPRTASVVALEDCRLAALTPEVFKRLLRDHPDVSAAVMQKLVAIVRAADERIMDLATLSAYQRVYSEVLKMMRPDPVVAGSWLVYPVPTQAQIASQASTTRETVARVLSQLTQAGIVKRSSKTLYIKDVEKLRQLAERLQTATPEEGAAS